ncbi:hypothetical protein BKA65DRAFT_556182 [Rhexocercosporidium sp. MPI-PUGE-AT-0058]|nr:hypothetical protein BKA65DRAFT_556182 [Rhexocercosporidium sp. MPI-PUGE-AT-0058]
MASSQASSVTLADESVHDDDVDVPMDIDSDDNNEGLKAPREFELPDEYFDGYDVLELSPSMKAAQEPDPRFLKAVLEISKNGKLDGDLRTTNAWIERSRYLRDQSPCISADFQVCSEFGVNSLRCTGYPDGVGITSPLMEAIRGRLPDNVDMLLDAQADPNGIPLKVSEMYAAFFLRFRPALPSLEQTFDVATRDTLLSLMDLHQLSILTREEVEDRFYKGVAPFWCEEGFVRADHFSHGESMPSLVEAARSGSIEIFDRLVAAGADHSFWMKSHIEVPNPPTSSSLSVSSPIHAALQTRDSKMLEYLLEIGFDPNTMPLANPTRCITPAMATIIYSATFNSIAFDILCQHPNINLELCTPVYRVHILHFAVATLDLDLLKHVTARTALQNAGETALGHTLLHVACMPANASQVQRHSELVSKSINECRDLRAQNDVHSRRPYLAYSELQPDPGHLEQERKNQTSMVKYLWEQGIQDLEVLDVHGNTALHYLAGCREFNWELIEWWWTQPGVMRIWQEANNRYEASPEELSYANQWTTQEEEREPGVWRPWFENWWKVGRENRKRNVWMRLLGDEEGAREWFYWSHDKF